jgi:hypothetical protein
MTERIDETARPMSDPTRTTRPYAKAHLDTLRRSDITDTEKVVLFVRQRLLDLGDTPTAGRIAMMLGCGERKVQLALKTLGLAKPVGRPRRRNAQNNAQLNAQNNAQLNAQNNAHFAPPIKTSTKETESIESGRGETPPPPLAPRTTGKETAAAAIPESQIPNPESRQLSVASLFAAPALAAEAPGHVAGDIAAGLYTQAGLDAWLASPGAAAAYPSHLKRIIPAFVAARRAEGFAAEVRQIRAGGLTRAVHRTAQPPRRAEVRLADAAAGLLVLEEFVGGQPGASAEALRREIVRVETDAGKSAFHRDAAAVAVRRLRARLAAMESGLPDPSARPPDRRRLDIRSAEALAEWRFEAEQPRLFLEDPA